MKSQLKRVVALVLTFSMALGLLQVNAFADWAATETDLSKYTITKVQKGGSSNFTFTGDEIAPTESDIFVKTGAEEEVALNDSNLQSKGLGTKDTDYTVTFSNNKNAGDKAMITIAPKAGGKSLTNTLTGYFTIDPYDVTTEGAKASSAGGLKLEVEEADDMTYDGSVKTPKSIKVKIGDSATNYLSENDYTIFYAKNDDAKNTPVEPKEKGTYKIFVKGKGEKKEDGYNLYGQATPQANNTIEITAAGLTAKNTKVTIPANEKSFVYDGADHVPSATVTYTSESGQTLTLTEGTDYDLSYTTYDTKADKEGTTKEAGERNTIGDWKVKVTGKGNFEGSVLSTDTYSIGKIALEEGDLTLNRTEVKRGEEVVYVTDADSAKVEKPNEKLVVTVKHDGNYLTVGSTADKAEENDDYTITYQKKNDKGEYVDETPAGGAATGITGGLTVGEWKVIVKGVNNYSGELSKEFVVNADNVINNDNTKITVTIPEGKEKKYDGEEKKLNTTATNDKLDVVYTLTKEDGSKETKALVEGVHYEIVDKGYSDNVRVGTATFTIKGIGNEYSGTATGTFPIVANTAKVNLTNVNVDIPAQVYTGEAIEPTNMVVTYKKDTLQKDVDFTVAYENNVNLTTADSKAKATLTATENGNFVRTKEVTFEIVQGNLADATVELDKESYEETGEQVKPEVTVKFGDSVVDPSEYDVTYGENLKEKGTVTVTAKESSKFAGTQTVEFTIAPATTEPEKLAAPVLTAFGKNSNKANGINIQWSAVEGADGYIVYRKAAGDDDYTQLCKRTADKYSNAGAGKQVNDTHVNGEHGTLYTYKVVAYKGEDVGNDSNAEEVIRMDPVTLKASALKTKGALNATWSRAKNGTGYLLQTSTSSDFKTGTKNRYVYGAKNVSWIRSQLKSGRNYVRVRVIRNYTAGEQWYYSAWSNVVPVNVR